MEALNQILEGPEVQSAIKWVVIAILTAAAAFFRELAVRVSAHAGAVQHMSEVTARLIRTRRKRIVLSFVVCGFSTVGPRSAGTPLPPRPSRNRRPNSARASHPAGRHGTRLFEHSGQV